MKEMNVGFGDSIGCDEINAGDVRPDIITQSGVGEG